MSNVAADLRALKSYTAAVEVYEQMAGLSPDNPDPLLSIGEIYLTQRHWLPAIDAFNRALARQGNCGTAQAGLATATWERGERLEALALWQMALANQPHLTEARLRLAMAYLNLNRPAEAEATLHAILVSGSGRPGEGEGTPPGQESIASAHLYLAMIHALDDAEGARRQLATIPNDAPQPVVATRDYMLAALKQSAADSEAARTLGLAFVQIEQWQLARDALERALALDPADAETKAFLGHVESQLGRPAMDHLAAAVSARPEWPLGHYLLGLYYVKHDLGDLAIEEFQETLRLDPGNAQAQVDLARAYISVGNYLDAESAYRAAAEAAPEDLTFQLALAHFYADHSLHVTDQGLAAAHSAAHLAPDDPRARDLLGWMYFLAGDPQKARLHLLSALRLDREQPSTYYHLGMLYQAVGQQEAAQSAFLRAVDLDTDGWYRQRAQAASSNE
jgi:tetratricopeptide (TPR) repeat protein